MAYQALYRKWRPLSFDDVVGQGHIVTTLKNEISSGQAGHAYLFCGTRGTGKTSCAKIFARAINCLNPKDGNPCNECEICKGALNGSIMDITEIDAASNNGVDNIREIRDEVSYSAAQAKYKIYIIDEVHMLSGGAFNALLKTLEEPPAHVIFILATTEAHKLPATITSRCQRFDFKRISVHDIVIRLREIVTAEQLDADADALELIARLGDGAMRDALSILDQCVGACGGKITLDAARNVLSVASDEAIDKAISAILEKDAAKVIGSLSDIVQSGRDINNFMELLLRRFRDILVCKVANSEEGLFEYSQEVIDSIKKSAKAFAPAELSYIIETLCGVIADAKWQKNARILYELVLMRLCDERLSDSTASLLARIENLEMALAGGAKITPPALATAPVSTVAKEEQPQDDAPPWEVEDTAPEPVIEPVPKAISEQPPVPKPEPVKPAASMPKVTKPVANVWGEVLGVLKKKNPPLYGMLLMKKAKFAKDTLYLISEIYVKEIITTFKGDFDSALQSVCEGARVNFVSESEFDMIVEEAGEINVAKSTPVNTSPSYDDEEDAPPSVLPYSPIPEPTDDDAPVEDYGDKEDPLDALLNMNNEDIIIEE